MTRFVQPLFHLTLLLASVSVFAQDTRTIEGIVLDESSRPIAGVELTAGDVSTRTSADGRYSLTVPADTSMVYFTAGERMIVVAVEDLEGTIILPDQFRVYRESVTVSAIRGPRAAPIAETTIGEEEIEEEDRGQDIPLLLERTPSVVSWADAGSGGSGYSYFSIRGISTTRINTTLDGVPLNDPAEHAIYFANFVDLASNVDSVQIQRGVGSSTLGSPVLGGSVNFASASPVDESGLSGYIGFGSYDQRRASIAWNTGEFLDGWRLYTRGSFNESDGYRDRSGVEQHSFWLSADHQTSDRVIRVFGFSGNEESELSYLATDEATLRTDPTFNPLTERDVDDFGQDLLKVETTWFPSADRSLALTGYYNGADGFFDVDIISDVLRFVIDGYQIGAIGVWSGYEDDWSWDLGAHFTDFERDHRLDIAGVRQYINTGYKNEATLFAKGTWQFDPLTLFGDLQGRYARFEYDGDVDLGSVDWTFFNPKVGARYALAPRSSLYGSIGLSQREPARADMLLGEDNATIEHDLSAVKPEELTDIEIGWDWATSNISTNVNLYAMEFRNEIALTGELSDIGLPTRVNVDRSYRRGIELDVAWQPFDAWVFDVNATFSDNEIEEWTQFYDVYDPEFNYAGARSITHRHVEPLLTPDTILNGAVSWRPASDLLTTLSARWVSESQLDNTGNPNFTTPSYAIVDLNGSIGLSRWLGRNAPVLQWYVRNALDEEEVWPSGYSYQYFIDGPAGQVQTGTSYYYPLAARSAGINFEWRM